MLLVKLAEDKDKKENRKVEERSVTKFTPHYLPIYTEVFPMLWGIICSTCTVSLELYPPCDERHGHLTHTHKKFNINIMWDMIHCNSILSCCLLEPIF